MKRLVGGRAILAAVALAGAIAAGAAVFVIIDVETRYGGLIHELDAAPAAPVAIVFGAGVRTDGRLSPMLRDRMDTAISLYQADKVRKLLVSGDNRFADYNEPGAMYDYAVASGVPAADVVRDYAGRRTYDTCYRARAIFGVTDALLVTQRFHLTRALFTCHSLGIDAAGVSADRTAYRSNAYYRLRDAIATLRAWWDVRIARPLPVLGSPEDMGL